MFRCVLLFVIGYLIDWKFHYHYYVLTWNSMSLACSLDESTNLFYVYILWFMFSCFFFYFIWENLSNIERNELSLRIEPMIITNILNIQKLRTKVNITKRRWDKSFCHWNPFALTKHPVKTHWIHHITTQHQI